MAYWSSGNIDTISTLMGESTSRRLAKTCLYTHLDVYKRQVLVALPFKLMIFVLADGWNLLIGSLAASFVT